MTGKSNTPNLKLSLLTSFEELETLEDAWSLLHSSSTSACLTNSFSYVYIAYRHFLRAPNSLFFISIYDSSQSKLVAIFPFVATNREQFDFNFKSLSFLGLDKFKKPSPLVDQNYTEDCWKLVLKFTLQSNKVWQVMDLGDGNNSLLKKRTFLENLLDLSFIRRAKDVKFQSFIQLNKNQFKGTESYFIRDEIDIELLKKYRSKNIESAYSYKVYSGKDLDYCFSQIMLLANNNQMTNNTSMTDATDNPDATDLITSSKKHLDFTYDFYQKYFCRMAYKNNLFFGMLVHHGKVIAVEIGYTEGNNLYLDTNLIDNRLDKNQVGILSLSLFLKHYSDLGFDRCQFLCAEDSRIPFLNANTSRIENQLLSKCSLKFTLALSLDLCARTSQKMQCKIKEMMGISANVKV